MRSRLYRFARALAAAGLALATPALAETPGDLLAAFGAQARAADPAFRSFSAAHGRRFFQQTHGGEWSCASCHTDDPAGSGKHARTGKRIEPLAPAVNPLRFSDPAKVEKWFRRNCNDVLGRACTAQEKGDVLAWLAGIAK
jgi:mono/diheme cytochrome c family protein